MAGPKSVTWNAIDYIENPVSAGLNIYTFIMHMQAVDKNGFA